MLRFTEIKASYVKLVEFCKTRLPMVVEDENSLDHGAAVMEWLECKNTGFWHPLGLAEMMLLDDAKRILVNR